MNEGKCNRCSNHLIAGKSYCPYCGNAVGNVKASKNYLFDKCKEFLNPKYCQSCGQKTHFGHNYCPDCGTHIDPIEIVKFSK